MNLSTEIKQAREKSGFTQEQAAQAWNIPLGTLKGYEKNQRQPRGLAMIKLREILSAILSAVSPAEEYALGASAPDEEAKPASASSAAPESDDTLEPSLD